MAVQSARPGHAPNVIMEPGSRGARGSGMRVQSHPAHAELTLNLGDDRGQAAAA